MKLEEMRYFVAIINTGSLSQAAKELFISQPALSRALAAMEKELGFPLLERSTHGITPTKEGTEVYNGCVRMLQLYNDTLLQWQALRYRFVQQTMVIHIVALPIACNSIMNDFFASIMKQYPRVQLKLYERQLQDILKDTLTLPHSICFSHYNEQSKADIEQFAQEHQMQIIPLFDDEYKLFAASDHPLIKHRSCLDNLVDYPFALYSNSDLHCRQQSFDADLAKVLGSFKQMLYLSNLHLMFETAATSQAITLSADLMTRDNIYRKNGQLLSLDVADFHLPMTYFLLVPAQATEEEKIVAELLREHYRTTLCP